LLNNIDCKVAVITQQKGGSSMYALAKVINLIIVLLAALIAVFTGEAPWLWLVSAVVVALAAPANVFVAKAILENRALSVKANVRKFARRRMNTAGFWFVISATVLCYGIIKLINIVDNSWIQFLPVAVFIIGWVTASKFRFNPDKYDSEADKQA